MNKNALLAVSFIGLALFGSARNAYSQHYNPLTIDLGLDDLEYTVVEPELFLKKWLEKYTDNLHLRDAANHAALLLFKFKSINPNWFFDPDEGFYLRLAALLVATKYSCDLSVWSSDLLYELALYTGCVFSLAELNAAERLLLNGIGWESIHSLSLQAQSSTPLWNTFVKEHVLEDLDPKASNLFLGY